MKTKKWKNKSDPLGWNRKWTHGQNWHCYTDNNDNDNDVDVDDDDIYQSILKMMKNSKCLFVLLEHQYIN